MHESTAKDVFLWLIRRRSRYQVTGASMQPLLSAGDEVLVDPGAYISRTPGIGDVVVARHPTQPGLQIIKRIAAIHEDGQYQLLGDNPDPAQNSPSRVSARLILGRVVCRFAPAR